MESKGSLFFPLPNAEESKCREQIHDKVLFDSLLLLLPNELLLKIMDFLSLSDLVLKLWPLGDKRIRLLCLEFCKSVSVEEEWDVETARKVILMAGAKLEHLTLYSGYRKCDLQNSLALLALESCPNLIGLYKNHPSLCEAAALTIGKRKSMRHLSLGNDACPECHKDFNFLWLASMRHLTELNLLHVDAMEQRNFIHAITENGKQLDTIYLPRRSLLVDEDFNNFLEEFQGRIRVLCVSTMMVFKAYRNLRNCTRLTHLTLHFMSTGLCVDGLTAISELSSQLQELNLSHTSNLAGGDFVKVFGGKTMDAMRCLKLTDIKYFDDTDLQESTKACPNLEVLCINYCRLVSDHGLRTILDHPCKKKKKLKHLNVQHTSITAKAFDARNSFNLKSVTIDEKLREDCARFMPPWKIWTHAQPVVSVIDERCPHCYLYGELQRIRRS